MIEIKDTAVTIDGRQVEGYTSIAVARKINGVAGTCSLESPPTSVAAVGDLVGAPVEIDSAAGRVFSGRVDVVRAAVNANDRSASQTLILQCRSDTAVLVDSTIPARIVEEVAVFKDKTLRQAADILTSAFGVSLVYQGGGDDRIRQTFTAETGEVSANDTPADVLLALANIRNAVLHDDPDGRLLITSSEVIAERRAAFIIDTRVATAATAELRGDERYHKITVRAEGLSNEAEGVKATATDSAVADGRRELTLMAKRPLSQGEALALAEWEVSRRAGEGATADIDLAGAWLFEPGEIVNVDLPAVGLASDMVVIGAEVDVSGESGYVGRIRVAPLGAIVPPPFFKRTEAGNSGGSGGVLRWIGGKAVSILDGS